MGDSVGLKEEGNNGEASGKVDDEQPGALLGGSQDLSLPIGIESQISALLKLPSAQDSGFSDLQGMLHELCTTPRSPMLLDSPFFRDAPSSPFAMNLPAINVKRKDTETLASSKNHGFPSQSAQGGDSTKGGSKDQDTNTSGIASGSLWDLPIEEIDKMLPRTPQGSLITPRALLKSETEFTEDNVDSSELTLRELLGDAFTPRVAEALRDPERLHRLLQNQTTFPNLDSVVSACKEVLGALSDSTSPPKNPQNGPDEPHDATGAEATGQAQTNLTENGMEQPFVVPGYGFMDNSQGVQQPGFVDMGAELMQTALNNNPPPPPFDGQWQEPNYQHMLGTMDAHQQLQQQNPGLHQHQVPTYWPQGIQDNAEQAGSPWPGQFPFGDPSAMAMRGPIPNFGDANAHHVPLYPSVGQKRQRDETLMTVPHTTKRVTTFPIANAENNAVHPQRIPTQGIVIDPRTGRELKLGPAANNKMKEVDVPSVSKLFADISSKTPSKNWMTRGRRRSVSDLQGGGHHAIHNGRPIRHHKHGFARQHGGHGGHMQGGLRGRIATARVLQSPNPTPPHIPRAPPPSPLLPHDQGTSAIGYQGADQGNLADGYVNGLGLLTDSTHMAGNQHLLSMKLHAGKTQSQLVGGTDKHPRNAPGRGGVLTGVLQEASAAHTRLPFRLEAEVSRKMPPKPAFKGVHREMWNAWWDAYITSQDNPDEKVFLGSFDSEEAAARAHDVAALRLHGKGTETNFPKESYEGVDEFSQLSPAEFILAMQRYAAFGNKKNSRYRGVWKLGEKHYESRYPETSEDVTVPANAQPEPVNA